MQIADTLHKITKAKRSQDSLTSYIIAQDKDLGNTIRYCASYLHFRHWLEHDEARLKSANFCKKHMLCPCCAVRRAAKMNEAYLPKIEYMMEQNPKLIPVMITLTVKNGYDLAERSAHLKSSIAKMLAAKRKANSSSGRHQRIEWNKVIGALQAFETTKSKNGQWHPHLHIFALLDDYIDPRKLSAEWQGITGDSKIVHVMKVENGVHSGLREVLKYSLKFSSMSFPDVYEAFTILKGKRLVNPQGCLRGVTVPDIDSDDATGLSGPYYDFIASWMEDKRIYKIRRVEEEMKLVMLHQKARKAAKLLKKNAA